MKMSLMFSGIQRAENYWKTFKGDLDFHREKHFLKHHGHRLTRCFSIHTKVSLNLPHSTTYTHHLPSGCILKEAGCREHF